MRAVWVSVFDVGLPASSTEMINPESEEVVAVALEVLGGEVARGAADGAAEGRLAEAGLLGAACGLGWLMVLSKAAQKLARYAILLEQSSSRVCTGATKPIFEGTGSVSTSSKPAVQFSYLTNSICCVTPSLPRV